TIISDPPTGPFPPSGPLYNSGTPGFPPPLTTLSVERINALGPIFIPEVTSPDGTVGAVYQNSSPNIYTIVSEVPPGVQDPGGPVPGTPGFGTFSIAEDPPAGGGSEPAQEIKTFQLPQAVCDGFVVMTEDTSSRLTYNWSDILVFWN